jgi:uncharacterized protein (DUF427 family)
MAVDAPTHLNQVIAKTGPVLVRTPRWVRAKIGDIYLADSKRVMLVRELPVLPVFAFPRDDVRVDLLKPSTETADSRYLGPISTYDVEMNDRRLENAAWSWPSPPDEYREVANHVAFKWDAVDHWYEEAEEIFRHPRDPFHRVDAIGSERHVRILHAGQVIADSRHPRLLFETGHPVRYYLPIEDVRMDLLEPTESRSTCPYKGNASYWRVKGDPAGRDIAWSYQDPIKECPSIRGLISFYNERVDGIEVDGDVVTKPQTNWS